MQYKQDFILILADLHPRLHIILFCTAMFASRRHCNEQCMLCLLLTCTPTMDVVNASHKH